MDNVKIEKLKNQGQLIGVDITDKINELIDEINDIKEYLNKK